jgi:uncharacterized membrane protein
MITIVITLLVLAAINVWLIYRLVKYLSRIDKEEYKTDMYIQQLKSKKLENEKN